ncbi:MAG: DsbA family oxidoreductase [Solirubrobacterales bacterium]
MQVEVWSDIVCPWCYIGNLRLKKAIAQLDDPAAVSVRTRSFELDPFATEVPRPNIEYLSEKYAVSQEQAGEMDGRIAALAEAEGASFVFPRPVANSFNLHRVVWLAREFDAGEQLFDRLQFEHFGAGADVFGVDELVAYAGEFGIPEQRVREVLAGKEFTDEVRADEAEARQIGVSGVPFAVLERKWAIPGAVATESYLDALKKIS